MTARQRRMAVTASPVPGPLAEGTSAFPIALPTLGRLGELWYENIVYSCNPGYRPLFLDLHIPQRGEKPPLIIWIHGGGWIYGSRRRLPPHLFENAVHDQMIEAGYAVASVDYRLAREAGFAGMLLDVKAAIRWLRGRKHSPIC
jgi:acetyl esterase/lipase